MPYRRRRRCESQRSDRSGGVAKGKRGEGGRQPLCTGDSCSGKERWESALRQWAPLDRRPARTRLPARPSTPLCGVFSRRPPARNSLPPPCPGKKRRRADKKGLPAPPCGGTMIMWLDRAIPADRPPADAPETAARPSGNPERKSREAPRERQPKATAQGGTPGATVPERENPPEAGAILRKEHRYGRQSQSQTNPVDPKTGGVRRSWRAPSLNDRRHSHDRSRVAAA